MTFIETLFLQLFGTGGLLLVAAFLIKPWLEKRIEKSIEFEYNSKLAELQHQFAEHIARLEHANSLLLAKFEHDQDMRLRAAALGELLSEWLRKPTPDKTLLNKLSFELALWLPADIAAELSNTLAKKQGAPSVHALLVKVRKLLHGASDPLTENDITGFY